MSRERLGRWSFVQCNAPTSYNVQKTLLVSTLVTEMVPRSYDAHLASGPSGSNKEEWSKVQTVIHLRSRAGRIAKPPKGGFHNGSHCVSPFTKNLSIYKAGSLRSLTGITDRKYCVMMSQVYREGAAAVAFDLELEALKFPKE